MDASKVLKKIETGANLRSVTTVSGNEAIHKGNMSSTLDAYSVNTKPEDTLNRGPSGDMVRHLNIETLGLNAWWPCVMGSGTTLYDFSNVGTIYNGTLQGPNWTTGRNGGNALNYVRSEADYVSAGDTGLGGAFSSGSQVFTITAWINPDSLSTTTSNHGTSNIIAARGSGTNNDVFELGVSSTGDIHLYIDENNDDVTKTYGAGEISTGSWSFISASYYKGSVKVFLNTSKYTGSFTGTTIDGAAGSPFTLGDTAHQSTPFDGQIGEVRVYQRELSDAVINDIRNGVA